MSSGIDFDRIFKALGHGVRRDMLDALKDRPMTTGMLVDSFPDIDRCTVMQHLGVLEGAGLVIAVRKGRERWNHLDAMPIQDIHERWIGPLAALQAASLVRMKRELEAGKDAKRKDPAGA
jgi:DNA-binding transcriptional ArsR family regulator